MVLERSPVSFEVQLEIVRRYCRGERVEDIKRSTGVTSVYPILRSEGLEPSRQRFVRRGSPKRSALACDDLLVALKAAVADKGPDATHLSMADYERWRATQPLPTPPSAGNAAAFFGSWSVAVAEAGIKSGRIKKAVDGQAVTGWLVAAAESLGTTELSRQAYDQWRRREQPRARSASSISSQGGWQAALRSAGLQQQRLVNRVTRRAAIAAVSDSSIDGFAPTRAEYDRWRAVQEASVPASATIGRRFGWRSICRDAGLEGRSKLRFTDAEIIDAVAQARAEVGEAITLADYGQWCKVGASRPSSRTVQRYVGWATALEHSRGSNAANVPIDEDSDSAGGTV